MEEPKDNDNDSLNLIDTSSKKSHFSSVSLGLSDSRVIQSPLCRRGCSVSMI